MADVSSGEKSNSTATDSGNKINTNQPTKTDSKQSAGNSNADEKPKSEQNGANPPAGNEPKKERPWLKPLLFGLLVLALILGIPWGIRFVHYSRTHVSTDDAYVTGNLISISPLISGTLKELDVDEGVTVNRGQIIARLDDAGPQSSLRQAQANYKAALSQIPQAERNLLYQQQATNAAIIKSEAALTAQRAKTSGAAQQVELASGTTRNQVKQAKAQIQQTSSQAAQANAQASAAQLTMENNQIAVQTSLAALENYRQQVLTAQKAVQTAQARVDSAQAEVVRTARDEARYRVLYDQDAVSAQVYDNAHAQARNARATLNADEAQVGQAQSQVVQAQDSVRQAESQVEQARKSVAQAQAQASAARRAADAVAEQIHVAEAGLGLAQAGGIQVGIQRANLLSSSRQTGESEADVAAARAGQEQVEVRRSQIETYRSQAQQAQAALTNAQITLNDTYIYAPNDGTIVNKNANVGASLAPGQTFVTMTQGSYVWVEANYKETQLNNVVPGEPVEIEVDAFPGKVFKGRVRSIKEATGAATSLLPPDNSTGNFTKVVQRVPVRIELLTANENDDKKFARSEDILNLRQGMSVVATIDTSDADKFRSQETGKRSSSNRGGEGNSEMNGSPAQTPGSSNMGGVNSPMMNGSSDTAAPGQNNSSSGTNSFSAPGGANAGGSPNAQLNQPNQNASGSNPIPNPGSGPMPSGGNNGTQNGGSSPPNSSGGNPGQAAPLPGSVGGPVTNGTQNPATHGAQAPGTNTPGTNTGAGSSGGPGSSGNVPGAGSAPGGSNGAGSAGGAAGGAGNSGAGGAGGGR